jgi:hemerythrin superfamily protein
MGGCERIRPYHFIKEYTMPDAIEMLREDHRKVKDLFEEFEKAEEDDEKGRIVHTALTALEIHATVEEEIFYPAVREQIDDDDQMDEALEEHHVAKLLIGELQEMKPGDDHFGAKFKVLAESVKHHIEEEETEMLPKAEDADLDQERLGEEMTERKEELQGQKGAGARGKISSGKTARRPALAKTKTAAKKNGKTKYRKSA